MKLFQQLAFASMMLLFISCSPKVRTSIIKSYKAIDTKTEIVVIDLDREAPENSEILGTVKTGDSGFSTNCGYDVMININKQEARKAGGNATKIISHRFPSAMGSTCHRITANILKVENIENYALANEEQELLDVDYAILNVYRFGGLGSLVGYNLRLGDSTL